MTINELVYGAYKNARLKGFWEDYDFCLEGKKLAEESNEIEDTEKAKSMINNAIGNLLMLIVSEVAEAQDRLRKGDKDNFKEELADIVIRTADLAGGLGIDLEAEIIKKMEKNKKRPYKHGKKF